MLSIIIIIKLLKLNSNYQNRKLVNLLMKFVKVINGTTSDAGDFEYKVNEVNIANNWNPTSKCGKDFGGFNYTTEDSILRWLHRGDTIYDVEIPDDAEVVKLQGATIVYRTNKIIVKNPRKVTDDMALYFYEISKIPQRSYYKALAAVSVMNYKKTAYAILKDKVNKNNIDEVLEEWNDFIFHKGKDDRKTVNNFVGEIEKYLYEIKSDLLISRFIDKEPYIKNLTNDKVINITGESGSGKSYFSDKYIKDDNYIVVDTDVVFSNEPSDNIESIELRNIFSNKPKNYLITNFDEFYLKVLNYFKDSNKTIVIDSAQYRNIKDYSILKGKIIVMRTCINTCYNRCIDRWKKQKNSYTEEELEGYLNKKLGMYKWYNSLNDSLIKIDKLS